VQVAAILGHELVHAAVGVAARHGKDFRRVAMYRPGRANGSDHSRAPSSRRPCGRYWKLQGPLPHGRLQAAMGASSHSNRRKKPSSRPIKCACSNCGYTVHTTRKWLELAGAPLCPKHGQMDTEKMQSPMTSITPSALVRVWHES
jgi:hypothetical protein